MFLLSRLSFCHSDRKKDIHWLTDRNIFLSMSFSLFLAVCHSVLSFCGCTFLPVFLCGCTFLPVFLCGCTFLPVFLCGCTFLPVFLCGCTFLPVFLCGCAFLSASAYLCVCAILSGSVFLCVCAFLSFFLSLFPYVFLSACLSTCLPVAKRYFNTIKNKASKNFNSNLFFLPGLTFRRWKCDELKRVIKFSTKGKR